ncbi:putative uncharacterized protein [Parachlamydia acanthamoebae UV-7]|uniref:Uncharacterized protein n=2 Tax=Parachlamydia acanthamoebae TaxID=83552 RepID=F8KZ16_PARAV|nr:hypothetical protein pah_c178o002 [Parachlamydia acanthamoebae str. Hall's coccus]KIA78140.1 hypothetical protein DB43_ES00140 [Parachlamydia acanthamoebae]CCB86139.1 putative uncharacterized protein [Parachlamydia acanthamoebae UV-7]
MVSSSAIQQPYLRRIQSIDTVIPALHLKGISHPGFSESFRGNLGRKC